MVSYSENIPTFSPVEQPSLPKVLVALPTKAGYELVKIEEIIYCKAEGNYTKILFTNGHSTLISRKLKETYAKLESNWFYRIHQSYLVNMEFARKYLKKSGGQLELADGTVLPVSKSYKEQVLQLFRFV